MLHDRDEVIETQEAKIEFIRPRCIHLIMIYIIEVTLNHQTIPFLTKQIIQTQIQMIPKIQIDFSMLICKWLFWGILAPTYTSNWYFQNAVRNFQLVEKIPGDLHFSRMDPRLHYCVIIWLRKSKYTSQYCVKPHNCSKIMADCGRVKR
jgi:hypothetical protein